MDLKKFSLGKEKETKSNTITIHNKESIRNKERFTANLEPPILRLDTDYGSTLYLKLCENPDKALYFEANLRYRESGFSTRANHFGYSLNVFPELNNELKVMSNMLDDISLRFYYNLIILGRICEAICKSGFSIDDVEFDRDTLNNFVNKSLKFYGYYDYKFDCNIPMNILHSNTESYDDFLLDNIYTCKEKFIIGDNKGVLGYTEKHAYLQMNKDNVITLIVSLAVDIMNTIKETSSSIKEALAWILLASKGYCVYEQNFINSRLFPSFNNWSDKEEKITPNNFAQCFKQS